MNSGNGGRGALAVTLIALVVAAGCGGSKSSSGSTGVLGTTDAVGTNDTATVLADARKTNSGNAWWNTSTSTGGSTSGGTTTTTTDTSTSSGGTTTTTDTSTSSGGTTTTTDTSTSSGGTTTTTSGWRLPSSQAWMTEDEEVAWINSLGFSVTVSDLRASYASFVPKAIDPNTSVLWSTESDELRNYYRLYKRTGYSGFKLQAQYWRDFMVNTYSNWSAGGSNVIEPEHIYMMGLCDWWVDNKDQATLDAIHRILDFILQKVSNNFVETRITARALQCLAYYSEKVGVRKSEADTKIQGLISGINAATTINGFVCFKFYQGDGMTVGGLPSGSDLRTLFPGNTAAGIVTGQNSFTLKGSYGVGCYQDCMLIHALGVAARTTGSTTVADKAMSVANAWLPYVARPFYDSAESYNLLVPYYVLPGAPEQDMFKYPGASSTPLYVTQYSAYCPDATKRKALQQEALLRGYGQYAKILSSELGGRPKYWPWQTWESGYFLTQK